MKFKRIAKTVTLLVFLVGLQINANASMAEERDIVQTVPKTIDISAFLTAPKRDEIKQQALASYEEGISMYAANTPTFNNHKITWKISSIYYYIHPSVSADRDLISNAGYNWVNTGYGWNNLYPCTQTTNIVNSAIDFLEIPSYPEDSRFVAYTLWYGRNSANVAYRVEPNQSNWLFCEVRIIRNIMNQLSRGDRLGILIHEMGHCWGLSHYNTNPYSIMCNLSAGRAVVLVQQCDHNTFKALYG